MTDFKTTLIQLNENLNTLREREAKFAGDVPLDLLNQISDHEKAIALTKQAIEGEIGEADWQETMKPLSVEIGKRAKAQEICQVTIGDVSGGIAGSVIAGQDVNVTGGLHLYQTPPPPTPSEHPPLFAFVPAMPDHFVGRDEMLETLISQLTSGQALALSAEGLGGVGKTALAVALAHHQDVLSYFKDGVLWAGLGPQAGESEVMSTLAAWGMALGQDISGLLDLTKRKQAVKQLIGQRSLLLVLDDVWQLNTAKALRCGGPHCCHLLTTRNKGVAQQFAGAGHTQGVASLEQDPAYTLLQALAPEACAADPKVSRELAQAVGGLPLALELLGGYLAEKETNLFPEMFDDLAGDTWAELSDPGQRLQLAQKRLGSRSGKVSLQDTLALSLDELQPDDKAAFYALGAFAPKPERFSRAAAEAVAETTGETLLRLAVRNLIEVEGKRFALHQVLADVAKTGTDDAAVGRHRTYYLGLANEDRQDWRQIERVYGQIRWGWQATTDDKNRLAWVWALREYQRLRGLWRDGLEWREAGLAATRALGRCKDEGTMLAEIGFVYNDLGQRDKALDYFQQALSILEEVGDRKEIGTTLNNIGGVYHNLGQRDKALDYFQQALPIREEVGDWAGVAHTLNNIGLVYDNLGQRDKALDYYQQALPISEEVGDRYGESVTRYNIALVYRAEGHLAEAEAQLKLAVKLPEQVQSPHLNRVKALLAQVQAEYDCTAG
jgi:tetratricopeptide (TPR) repeat protein